MSIIPPNLIPPPTPTVFILWSVEDIDANGEPDLAFENVFSRREYAEARAEVIRKGDNPRTTEIEEVPVDDPWSMPVKPVPLAEIQQIQEIGQGHSEPIE